MKTINIHCDGGFGNRFNALVTGLFLAARHNLRPMILWPLNNQVGARFDEIFDTNLSHVTENVKNLAKSISTTNILHGPYINPDRPWTDIHSNLFTIDNVIQSSQQDLIVTTDSIPSYVDIESIKNNVIPLVSFKSHTLDRVNQVLLKRPNVFYGIHLRKTDFGIYRDENEVANIIDNHKDKLFFVCSDDKAAEDYFSTRTNVFCHTKQHYVEKLVEGGWNTEYIDVYGHRWPFNVNRNSACVLEGIVDLLILSKSDLQFSTGVSTFLHTARLLKQCQ